MNTSTLTMRNTIRWTPEIEKALGKVMDPGSKEDIDDLFWNFQAQFLEIDERDPEAYEHCSLVAWSTDKDRELFWSHWEEALGDNASLYDRETILGAIDDLLNNGRSWESTEKMQEIPAAFNIMPLVWLNPRTIQNNNHYLPAPFASGENYDKLDAITVFMRRNPMAPDLLSVLGEQKFVELMESRDDELVRLTGRTGQLGLSIASQELTTTRKVEAFSDVADWFAGSGVPELSKAILEGARKYVFAESWESRARRVSSDVSDAVRVDNVDQFWSKFPLNEISKSLIKAKGKTMEMLALRKGWINVFLQSLGALPYATLYNDFV